MSKKEITNETIIMIAEQVAKKINIKIPDKDFLMSQLNSTRPIPTICKTSEYWLWVDIYYVAFKSCVEEGAHYVYIHKSHIKEEEKAYREAIIPSDIPPEILVAFNKAQYYMEKKGLDFWVHNKYIKYL